MLDSEITIKIDRKVIALLLSIILHVVLFLGAGEAYQYHHSIDRIMEKTAPLVMESLSREALEEMKVRTVGKKDGAKGAMAIPEMIKKAAGYKAAATQPQPIAKANPQSKSTSKSESNTKTQAENVAKKLAMLEHQRETPAQQKKLNLSSLALTKTEVKADYRRGKNAAALKSVNLKGSEIREFLKNDNIAAPMLSPQANPFLANSGIDVKMEVPEGVDISELNDYELQFYSFQKRTAISYISSFYKTLDDFVLKNPQIRFPLSSGKETMTGRVTFDKDGNILEIRMIRASSNGKMQVFFEDVLEGIRRLPNPPKSLVKDQGQFNIFYTLVING
ncbi:MAG: TonB C-terminal domain-containing protein [Bacteriovoracaceae bacterium]